MAWRRSSEFISAFLAFFFLFLLILLTGNVRGDRYEENDDMGNATIIQSGMHPDLLSTDPDWYDLSCNTTGILRVIIWYPEETGTLELILRSSDGTLLNISATDSGEEMTEVPSIKGDRFFIEINTMNGTFVEYHLAIVNGNQDSWIFSVYMDGDNSLNDDMEPDLQEMRQVGSSSFLHIPVLMDGDSTGDSKVLYIIPGDMIELPLYVVNGSWENEPNMGEGDTLRDWLSWCIRTFDTNGRIALDLWDHGRGVWGCCWDSKSGNDLLEIAEIRDSISASIITTGSQQLELLGSDSCLMQVLELSSEVENLTRYYIASEEDEPKAGWEYSSFLQELTINTEWTGKELGISIIQGYFGEYGYSGKETLSVLDLGHEFSPVDYPEFGITTLVTELANLSDYLRSDMETWADEVRAARTNSEDFNSYYADLLDFITKLGERTDDPTILGHVGNISRSLDNIIVHEEHGSKSWGGTGLTIYFPESDYDDDYDEIPFSVRTGWGDLLKEWIPVEGGPTDHFQHLYFELQDNDTDEYNDTVLVKYRPYTDRDSENITIIIELLDMNNTVHNIMVLNETIHLDNAPLHFMYICLPYIHVNATRLPLNGLYRVKVSLYDSEQNRDAITYSPDLQLYPLESTYPVLDIAILDGSGCGCPGDPVDSLLVDHGDAVILEVGLLSGNPVLFTWDLDGDGNVDVDSTETGNITHTYDIPGYYNATLRVTDEWDRYIESTVQIHVNNLPVFTDLMGLKYNPGAIRPEFHIQDSDGTIILIEWDLDDDGTFDGNSTTPEGIIIHLNESGDHLIRFRATDNDHGENETDITIHINHPPTLISGLIFEPVLQDLSLNGNWIKCRVHAIDPDGAIMTYHWYLDTGHGLELFNVTTENWTLISIQPGQISIQLTIFDDMGLSINMTGQYFQPFPPEVQLTLAISSHPDDLIDISPLIVPIDEDIEFIIALRDLSSNPIFDGSLIVSLDGEHLSYETFSLSENKTGIFNFLLTPQINDQHINVEVVSSNGTTLLYNEWIIRGSEPIYDETGSDGWFSETSSGWIAIIITVSIIIILFFYLSYTGNMLSGKGGQGSKGKDFK